MNYLRGARITVALLAFTVTILIFIDVFGVLPREAAGFLHAQFIPALLSGMWIVAILLVAITLLFGRLYCSILCPAGILQDVFNRLAKRGIKRNKHKRYFHYAQPHNWLRYSVLAVTIVAFVLGSSTLVLLLDPYSNMGRVLTALVRPVVILLHNLIAKGFSSFGWHTVPILQPSGFSFMAFAAALLFLAVIAVMSLWKGRLYCNTLCPVGSLLGLLSKVAPFRIVIKKSACNHCGTCALHCKSECIDSKNGKIDASRCVVCFNCIASCPHGALSYSPSLTFPSREGKNLQFALKQVKQISFPLEGGLREAGTVVSRRTFLLSGATLMAAVPAALAQSKSGAEKTEPVMPPGAGTREHFTSHCTACHLCVAKCPSSVLKPAAFDYGLMGIMQPKMTYDNDFCQPDCTDCSHVCPTGAIRPLTLDEKRHTQIGIAVFTEKKCVVYTEETDCGACSEHCPTQAVSMVDYKDGLRIPHVTPEICVGCGACECVCPARPKAIVVHAHIVQQQAHPIPKEKEKEHKVDDFGF